MKEAIWIKSVNDGRYIVEPIGDDPVACNDFTEMIVKLSVLFGEPLNVEDVEGETKND